MLFEDYVKDNPVHSPIRTQYLQIKRQNPDAILFFRMGDFYELFDDDAEIVARELEIAKEVQARLFPRKRPAVETLDYAGVCIQARQVGGDYYDFLDLGPKRLGLVIGDVVGKGIAAALLMANLQANLRSQCAIALDRPRDVLRAVNRLFCENTPDGGFATLFFAEYEQATGRLRYVNCGHLCAVLLRGDDTVERLEATGTVLGLFEDWDCEMGERTIVFCKRAFTSSLSQISPC